MPRPCAKPFQAPTRMTVSSLLRHEKKQKRRILLEHAARNRSKGLRAGY